MSSTSDSRGITIVLSIDCVNADLLDQWTADGTLPELARLRKQGVCGNIQCPLGSVEGDWFSLYTGQLPSWHGHVSYDEIIPGTYRSNTTIGSRAAVDPFWIVASDAGRQVTVFNAPHIERSSIVHGIQIESWLTHDAGHYTPCTAYPPKLKDELLRRAPTDPVHPNDWGITTRLQPDRLLFALNETLEKKTSFICDHLKSKSPDFVFACLDECHELGHLTWHLSDQGHPRYTEGSSLSDGPPLTRMLKGIDSALGQIVKAAGNDANVMILTIAGIGPNYGWSYQLDDILRRMETGPTTQSSRSTQSPYDYLRGVWQRIPHGVKKRIFSFKQIFRERLLERRRRQRLAFALPMNERDGAVRINLIGREPDGLVSPGAAYDQQCQSICDALHEIVCVDTGAPLVVATERTALVPQGPYATRLADIFVKWNTTNPIRSAWSPRIGTVTRDFSDARSGMHLSDGFFIATGPAVSSNQPIPTVPITAVAPTVLGWVGITLRGEAVSDPIPGLVE